MILADLLQVLLNSESETFIKIISEPERAFIPIQVRLILKNGKKHKFIDELLVKECNLDEEKAVFTELISRDKILPKDRLIFSRFDYNS